MGLSKFKNKNRSCPSESWGRSEGGLFPLPGASPRHSRGFGISAEMQCDFTSGGHIFCDAAENMEKDRAKERTLYSRPLFGISPPKC